MTRGYGSPRGPAHVTCRAPDGPGLGHEGQRGVSTQGSSPPSAPPVCGLYFYSDLGFCNGLQKKEVIWEQEKLKNLASSPAVSLRRMKSGAEQ